MHRAAENLEVAKRENSVISYESNYKTKYQGFDPNRTESYIIFELMQDRYLSESIKLAKAIQQQYSNAGRRNKGVHQAGFLVLRETSMPSVLTELGFISNANEERFLHSQAGADELAGCLFRGFQAYRKRSAADAGEGTAEPANGTMLADNSKLPPIYVAPEGEPSIRPVPTTPYMALTETPQEHRAAATPADIATDSHTAKESTQTPETERTYEKIIKQKHIHRHHGHSSCPPCPSGIAAHQLSKKGLWPAVAAFTAPCLWFSLSFVCVLA